MTGAGVIVRPTAPAPPPRPPEPGGGRRPRTAAVVAALGLVAAGIAMLVGALLAPSSSRPATSGDASYAYYRYVVDHYGGSMMGGSSMTGGYSYGWMMGGASAPGWMMGGDLPPAMMGGRTDPGQVMGRLWAGAPGPRVTPAEATRLGNQTPAGATVDRASNSIAFSGGDVSLVLVASPPAGSDETFRAAGLTNPTISVPAGTRVTMELVNADPDAAHGVVVTANAAGASSSWMPMMAAAPAFAQSAIWFLGNPTSAGLHTGSTTFTAGATGTYQYLCPVPGHAQKGMVGAFVVR